MFQTRDLIAQGFWTRVSPNNLQYSLDFAWNTDGTENDGHPIDYYIRAGMLRRFKPYTLGSAICYVVCAARPRTA